MAIDRKLCVFCGRNPESKNREHVLPQWLIELTGHPKRVVTFGVDYSKGKKPIRFDWASLVVPACEKCNGDYSTLETRAKEIVMSILDRRPVMAESYLTLLNWLDKVRIGIWLNYRLLENYPIQIQPNFYINQRIATKDRMVGVYLFDKSEAVGLNAFGMDSRIFADMPSCFSLRINNILLTNVSADFFCSANCGFPYPRVIQFIRSGPDVGKTSMQSFCISRKRVHPISEFRWIKPSISLFQPIMLPASGPPWQGGFLGDYNLFDGYLYKHKLEGQPSQGVLFRQWADRVEPIYDTKSILEFDKVVGDDSKTMNEIVAQTYDFQLDLYQRYPSVWADGFPPSEFDKAYEAMKVETTAGLADFYRHAS